MGVDLHADWIRISKAGQGDEPEFSGATLSAVADGEIGIEDPDLLPVVGVRGDEDLVPLGLLIGVVGGARVEHDVEGERWSRQAAIRRSIAAGERFLSRKKTEWASMVGESEKVTDKQTDPATARRQSRATGTAPGSGGGGSGAAGG